MNIAAQRWGTRKNVSMQCWQTCMHISIHWWGTRKNVSMHWRVTFKNEIDGERWTKFHTNVVEKELKMKVKPYLSGGLLCSERNLLTREGDVFVFCMLCTLCCPNGKFSHCKNRVAFPKESQLQQSRATHEP